MNVSPKLSGNMYRARYKYAFLMAKFFCSKYEFRTLEITYPRFIFKNSPGEAAPYPLSLQWKLNFN